MKRVELFLFLLVIPFLSWIPCIAQRNNVWCFGDSAGINFNLGGSPSPITTSFRTRGTCVSISDTSGSLLFYGNSRSGVGFPFSGLSGQVWNRNNQLMINGDSITAGGWYYEMVIIPDVTDDSSFYLFVVGVTDSFGLTYCKIDMRGDSGMGAVVQKNVSLIGNTRMVDCLLAVKHGNGRDWWIIARESPVSFPNTNNTWYVYLVSPSGITSLGIQNVGTLNGTNSGVLAFDTANSRLCFVSSLYLIELYDFDRCTGLVSNPLNIAPQSYVQPLNWNWSCEFSPSGQYLYVSTWISNDSSYLWQYDTWSANIAASKTLIWQSNYPVSYVIGQLKRAPDGKIYLSNGWVDTTGNYQFPYLSNQYYPENMNLSVINSPDLPGTACDFQPYSFYLGGKRTYWGLPNNPDYELGPLIGSGCDTLTALPPTTHNPPPTILNATWSPNWQKALINATNLKGHKWRLEVFDLFGNIIYRDNGSLTPPYFSRGIELPGLASGMYVVRFQTEKELLTGKFMVEK